MATNFTELYPIVRTLLGDIGALAKYSTIQLDLVIRAALLKEEGFNETTPQVIDPAITSKTDLLRIAIRSALAMVRPSSGPNSYRTAALAVTRGGGADTLVAKLEQELHNLEDGRAVFSSWSDLDKWRDDQGEYNTKMSGA